jgi:hypothetical protein
MMNICPECDRSFAPGEDSDSEIAEQAAGKSCRENAHWKLQGHMNAAHPDAGFECPRRREGGINPKGRDWWRRGGRDGCCSYCGSMTPADLFKAIEAGTEITPTDKSYKIYVGGAGKFYFQHLSDDEQQKFIDLYNAKKITLASPGYFYVTPFFAKPHAAEQAK